MICGLRSGKDGPGAWGVGGRPARGRGRARPAALQPAGVTSARCMSKRAQGSCRRVGIWGRGGVPAPTCTSTSSGRPRGFTARSFHRW
eukprot:scaffold1554_cov401-Prasinococcus_capsulatus_cf.AAC.15